MACVGLRCGNGVEKSFFSSLNVNNDNQRQSRRSCSCRRQLPQATVMKAISQQPQSKLPSMPLVVGENLESSSSTGKGEISNGILDVWMREAVSEIVKKIEEAPFLVHVFSAKMNGNTKVTRLDKEKAVAEEWPLIKRRWEEREEWSTPDGIMLVEELKDENHEEEDETKAWGVVLQGRGLTCSPACYILKTCRVGSPSIGFCTHFCLMKAQFYGETALQQLKNSWLLHPQFLDQHSYFF